jgi:hypothetical protein
MENKFEFSVYWWDPVGNFHDEIRWATAEQAVEVARSLTARPAAQIGVIRRVIITDGGDFTVFEWKFGEGVTFPAERSVQ